MKRNLNSLNDWLSQQGSYVVSLAAGRTRGVFVAEDCNLLAETQNGTVLLFSGSGRFEIDFSSDLPVELRVVASGAEVWSSLQLAGWHADAHGTAGWSHAPSLAQLDPKPRDYMSPEVKAMFDLMQRNMLQREAALRADLERRLGRAS